MRPRAPRRPRDDGLEKYLRLGPLSLRELVRVLNWDRPPLSIRKTPVADLVAGDLPEELREWGSKRSSEAMLEAGSTIIRFGSSREQFRSILPVLGKLRTSQPAVLRTVVWPAIRGLQEARSNRDEEVVGALEALLLALARRNPDIVVSGLALSGNPRFRGASGRGKKRWGKAHIAQRIAAAFEAFRASFMVPVGERLARSGDAQTLRTLARISDALDAIVRAMSRPNDAEGSSGGAQVT